MYDYEQALEDARFFEKNINKCQEYADAWVFQNTKKRWGSYNPIVIYKDDGEAAPYYIYEPTKLVNTFMIDRANKKTRFVSEEEKTIMTNTELTEIRESLSLTKGELAKKLDVSPMILGRYEKGSLPIPETVAERVKGMVESKDTPAAPTKKSRKGAVKKDTATKVAEKPVEEKVSTPATADEPRKPAKFRRKKSATPTLIIQSLLGGTITPEEIMARVPVDVDTVYIKPEENKAYWVRGDETGSVELW